MIYYDVTDLVRHAEHSRKVTGVQRVVLEGMRGLEGLVVPVFLSPMTGKWYRLEGFDASGIEDLTPFVFLRERADLIAYPTRDNVRRYLPRALPDRPAHLRMLHKLLVKLPFWRRKLNRYTAVFSDPAVFAWPAGPNIRPMPVMREGDQFVCFGTPWNTQRDYDVLIEKLNPKVTKTFLVHDLIPLNSAYVPDNLRDLFRVFIPFVIKNADRLIAASDSIISDIREYARLNGLSVPTIHKVNLAHHLPPPKSPTSGDASLRVRKLFAEKYVLCVGSIESRKNHLNLLIMWSKFVSSADYGGEKLVIAGVWAWDFQAVQNLLHETGHIYGSVIIIEQPDEAELRQLYRHCRFTAYPSHYEGWGLPVGESLSFGKPCIHFDNSSLREAGLGMSDVVPYHNMNWFYKLFRKLMIDDRYYKERCKNILAHQDQLRSWSNFSREVSIILNSNRQTKTYVG